MNELHYQIDLLKAMNQKLSVREKMYHIMCDTADSALLYYSFDDKEVTCAGRWSEFFDFDIFDIKDISRLYEIVEETAVVELMEALYPEKNGEATSVFECCQRDKSKWYRFRVNVMFDDIKNPTDKVIRITDITMLKKQHEELTYLAYYDKSTGLYNRNYFVQLLENYLKRADELNDIVSVLVIDVDDFHKIKDGYGMVVGDEVIHQLGDFLNTFSGENVIVCHMDSDVYCMGIYSPAGKNSIKEVHKTIQNRIKKPFVMSNGREVFLTVSVGVAEYPEAAVSALELINCAEIVMYKCKDLGKNAIHFYDTNTLNEFLQTVEIENKLKEAISNQNFELYYQPQYYVGNKRLRGMEALIRWRDGEDKMISPGVFIPIAEKNGAIISIGTWVVEQSIRQYASWRNEYGVHLILSINISARQFEKENFVELLLKTLRKYDVDFSEIELEITESILIEDSEVVTEKLKILKNYGIRISLDDFGTGFSSLSYLKTLPINTLKIDKSFIDTVLSDSATRVITESIVDMVKSLGFESIAEGVEDEQQYKYLHAIGCDVIQGYFLGKPLPASEMEKLIQTMV
ncbi:MAG: bifunctional diguanylate cyclase/phosphodiesterase [Lachnospiraceae bacterium]|nr:bifunctional diguanylate cyclase/phosphodiesterase [Lachnospiraceae bacterium]